MLKTLDLYIEDQPGGTGPLAPLWSKVGRDRRFTVLLALSVTFHVIFYAVLIKLDSLAMMRAIASGKQQVSLVKLIELAPPPDRSTLRTAPEPLERADMNRLQFDPANADDVHLVPRSPKPVDRRGHSGQLPPADQIERQLRSTRGSSDRDRPGPVNHQPTPPTTSAIQANRIPQFEEALIAQTPPSQAAPLPPAPSIKQDANATNAGTSEATLAGTRRGSSSESTALGLEAAQGQVHGVSAGQDQKVKRENNASRVDQRRPSRQGVG